MSLITLLLAAVACGAPFVSAAPLDTRDDQVAPNDDGLFGSCYPALDFVKPLIMPHNNTHWWCDPSTEYAFMGFSYEITDCEYLYPVVFSGLPSHHCLRPKLGPAKQGIC